jgi:hypothetical protein
MIKLFTLIEGLTKNSYHVIAGKVTSNETLFIFGQAVSCPPDSASLFFLANIKNCRLHYSSSRWTEPLLKLAHDYLEKHFDTLEEYATLTCDENSCFFPVNDMTL